MVIADNELENYKTVLANGKEVVYADVTPEKGGQGVHFRPHDFLEAGYAACLNITTRMVLDQMGLSYETVTVKVELDREIPDKTIFNYRVDIIGNIDAQTKNKVLRLVENCPVRKTLSKQIEFQKLA